MLFNKDFVMWHLIGWQIAGGHSEAMVQKFFWKLFQFHHNILVRLMTLIVSRQQILYILIRF